MPHIEYGNDEYFDLEIEKFKNTSSFLKYLKTIIDGKPVEDKYGQVINLRTTKEKLNFIRELNNNSMFQKFVSNKLSNNEREFLNLIMSV